MARILLWIFGSLTLCILGDGRERFVNLCAQKGIVIRNLRIRQQAIYMTIRLKDFYRIRQAVRKTKVKVILKERLGLPFLLPKMKRRCLFFLCAMLAMLPCLLGSQFLWTVNYEGNERITNDQLNDFCLRHDIKKLMPVSKIDATSLEGALRREFPSITWVSVTHKGSSMTISVKENLIETIADQTENVCEDLLSPYRGKVVSMVVRNGIPKVSGGECVEEGQVLIEGRIPIYDDGGSIKDWIETLADGDVWLEHFILLEDAGSAYHIEEYPTGRLDERLEVWMQGKRIKEIGGLGFYNENRMEKSLLPNWLQETMPGFKIQRIKLEEKQAILFKYGEEELKELLGKKLLRFLTSLEEKGVQIIEKNVRIDIEGDFWILHGSVKVLEKVTKKQDKE